MVDLAEHYQVYNRRYFGGCLPEIPVIWSESTTPEHVAETVCDGDQTYIQFSLYMQQFDRYTKLVLIHEMVHVKQRNEKCAHHGHKFQKEMKRLANIGAFRGLW